MGSWARNEVRRAFAQQLRDRAAFMDAGAAPLGWKLGAGSAAAMARLGIDAPLVGYLLSSGLISSGAAVSVEGWTHARIETEIAVRIGEQLDENPTPADCVQAIDALALAFELVDVNVRDASAEEMLRRNVFHKALVLGEWIVASGAAPPVSVRLNEELVSDAIDPLAAVGDLAELVRHVAQVLAANDIALAPGSLILTGAVTLPPPLSPGQHWRASARELGQIEISVTS